MITDSDANNEPDLDFGDLDETYENTKAPAGSADSIPDGSYDMVIVNAYATKSEKSGNRLFKWRVKVLGPRLAGTALWRNSTIEAERIKWLKKDMQSLGIDLPKLSLLTNKEWVAENIIGLKVSTNVKNKDGYCNIYFNRADGKVSFEADNSVDESGGFITPTTAYNPADDDVPF